MALYFVLKASDTGYDTLLSVSEPTKNAKGKYNVQAKSVPLLNKDNLSKVETFSSMSNMISPRFNKHRTDKEVSNAFRKPQEYLVSLTDMSFQDLITVSNTNYGTSFTSKSKDYDIIKSFMNLWDKSNVNYIEDPSGSIIATGDLKIAQHTRGNWRATKTITTTFDVTYAYSPQAQEYKNKKYKAVYTMTNNDKSFKLSQNNTEYFLKPPLGVKTIETTTYTLALFFTQKILAAANTWELGALAVSGNPWGDEYCFYCQDTPIQGRLSHFSSRSRGLPRVLSKNKDKCHSYKIHGDLTFSSSGVTSAVDNSASTSTTYDPYKTPVGNGQWSSVGQAVTQVGYGTKGTYTDGVATLPYVMIELLGSDTAEQGSGYNLSIPANSFVSLSHERNLGDGYNTFSLQLFDKDALQVEAKLVLGFRYIIFYYTDFVSTSKRFRGQVLDYQTTITGKGLMLTLKGYTSSTNIYTGKESIPWSIICEARDYAFWYWTNEAGEYHGPLRFTTGTKWTGDGKSESDTPIYNSTTGTIIGKNWLDVYEDSLLEFTKSSDRVDCTYCLQAPMSKSQKGEGDSDSEVTTEWVTFDYYYSKASEEDKERYRPYAKLWTLAKYNSNISNELSIFDSIGDLTEKRPSNIIYMICVINKWKWDPKYIRKTRKVSEIPDMVSQSFTEYIKETLIPLSVEEGGNGSTQYNFWFDDDGYVHFQPGEINSSAVSLYFNSKEKKDSYPLISFSAASNGSVLMQTDASQVMQSVNMFTGDAIEVSSLQAELGDDFLTQINKQDEWFATNSLTKSDNSKLVSYSGKGIIASEEDLKKQLRYKYGLISKYSYEASLDVYACSDITPGQMVDIYIYIGDGIRSSAETSVEDKDSPTGYIGNITLHHSSGRYFVNKITDIISGGKYISTLNVLKIDKGTVEQIQKENEESNTENEERPDLEMSEGAVINTNNNSYTWYKNLTN